MADNTILLKRNSITINNEVVEGGTAGAPRRASDSSTAPGRSTGPTGRELDL